MFILMNSDLLLEVLECIVTYCDAKKDNCITLDSSHHHRIKAYKVKYFYIVNIVLIIVCIKITKYQ